MPKAKPDHLQAFRIELNEKEREALSTFMFTSGVRNVGQGLGAVMTPILNNLVAIVGFIIAKEGVEWLLEAFERAAARSEQEREDAELTLYERYVATTDEDPPKSFDEYQAELRGEGWSWSYGSVADLGTDPTTSESSYKRANWWKKNVGDPLNKGLQRFASGLKFW